MKKLFTTALFITGVIMASINKMNAETILASPLLANKHQHEVGSEKLVLNKGEKWKVDHTTSKNINDLKLILKASKMVKNQSLTVNKKTGDSLQNSLMILIKECINAAFSQSFLPNLLDQIARNILNIDERIGR